MALGTKELLLILRARDEASRVLRSVVNQLTDLDDVAKKAAKNQITAGTALTSLGIGITAVGAAGVKFLMDATDEAKTFQKAIALVSTQTDNVAISQQQLSDVVKRTAREVAVPISQLSSGLFDIFSSMDVNVPQAEILLKALARSAVAGATDLETAGRATIAIMNAWKIPAEKVNTVLDVQFKLVQKGVGTYEQFATAIGKAVPSAQRAGQSVETLAGMLAYLTRNGLSADMAAASAGRAFDAMSNPKVTGRLEKMGIATKDASGNFRDMGGVITDLQKVLGNMTDPERAKALADLFKGAGGTIQARRFYDLVLKDAEAAKMFTDLVGEMNNASGQFTAAYDTMAATGVAQSQILANNWELLKIELGEKLLPVVIAITGYLIDMFNWWNNLSSSTKDAIMWTFIITTGLILLTGVVVTLVGLFTLLSGAAAILGIGIGALVAIIGGIVLAIIAIVAIGWVLWKNWDAVSAAIVKAWDWVLEKLTIVWEWLKDRIGDKVGGLFNKMKDDVMGAIGPMADFVIEMWQKISDWAQKTWPAIQGFIQPTIDWFIAIWPYVQDIIAAVLNAVVDLFKIAWDFVVAILKGAWEVIKGLVEGLWLIFKGLVDLILGIFTGDWQRAWDGILSILDGIAVIIVGVLKGLWEILKGIWNGGIDFLIMLWDTGLAIIVAGAGIVWETIKTAVSNFWEWLKSAFNHGVDALSSIWDGLKDIMRTPVNWVLQHVYNEGIVPLWNGIADLVGLGKLDAAHLIGQSGGGSGRPMLAMAKGGVLPGYSPGVDNLMGSFRGQPIGLSGGEGILVPEAVRGLGAGFVHWANDHFSGGRAGSRGTNTTGFADGGIVSSVLSFVGDIGSTALAAIKDPIGFIQSQLGGSEFVGGIAHMMGKSVDGVIDKLWSMIKGAMGGGGVSGDLASWIKLGMGIAGVDASWFGPLSTLIMRESGGNPNAINLWDSNAQAGHPSQGLMQTIPGTFAAYRDARLPNEITNPVANIVAGINYIKARYGSIFNVQQAVGATPMGYDAGGMLPPGFGTYFNGTGEPEVVLTSGQWHTIEDAIRLATGGGSMGAGTGTGGSVTVNNYWISMTIVTQEIDPRAHAIELGREIGKGV